jgi:hypothetical protein
MVGGGGEMRKLTCEWNDKIKIYEYLKTNKLGLCGPDLCGLNESQVADCCIPASSTTSGDSLD